MKIIHIGLPKNASTSLQSQWSLRQDINYASDSLYSLVTETRKAIVSGSDPNQLLELWPRMTHSGEISLYSSEGLCGLPWGYQVTEQEYDYGQYLFANICKEMEPDAYIFLVVRSPEKWLRSVYLQMIQEGANFGYASFIRKQKEYLRSVLNLKTLLQHWQEAYGEEKVIVYPFEKLVEQPSVANTEISHRLGISASLNLFNITSKSNTSLSVENAQLLRALSILNKRIKGKDQQLALSFNRLNEDLRQLYRVQLQHTPKKFSFLKKLLAPMDFSFPHNERLEFNSLLLNSFVQELTQQDTLGDIVSSYKANIDKYFTPKEKEG
ncbi:sulfotransferase [Alteromonas sp. a30]|uniref:sulfotransferase n=1 Tax=Alteromonas sp. a30 TaxID=2730917 RepID=UPI002282E430|nr:sulfotransferase [Alteromonas sp. a30]MCY7296620.1 hypothetical protein [Alteromonas sp. a30]